MIWAVRASHRALVLGNNLCHHGSDIIHAWVYFIRKITQVDTAQQVAPVLWILWWNWIEWQAIDVIPSINTYLPCHSPSKSFTSHCHRSQKANKQTKGGALVLQDKTIKQCLLLFLLLSVPIISCLPPHPLLRLLAHTVIVKAVCSYLSTLFPPPLPMTSPRSSSVKWWTSSPALFS